MDNVKLDTPLAAAEDHDKTYDEIVEIFSKLNEADYIHFNIPIGDNAITKYQNTIRDMEFLDVNRFDLSDFDSESNYVETLVELINTLKYYKGIAEVYDKTDFVIDDNIDLEILEQDNDAIYSIYISSKEKYLLNKAIDKLNAKIIEMDKLRSNYKKMLVMI